MYTKRFWKDAFERAVATALEVAIPMVVAVETIDQLDYRHLGLVAVSAAVLSVMKAVAATLKGDKEDASLVR